MLSDYQDTGYSLRSKIYHHLKNAILGSLQVGDSLVR